MSWRTRSRSRKPTFGFWAHFEAAKRYLLDFKNPVEWHEEMLARQAAVEGKERAHNHGQANRGEHPSVQADSASDVGHSASGHSREVASGSERKEECTFCECGRPLHREIGEHPRGILRLPHLCSNKVGPHVQAESARRDNSGTGQSQSSAGKDRTSSGLPLCSNKTVTWADDIHQAIDGGALVDSAQSGECDNLVRHLRLRGIQRGGDHSGDRYLSDGS